MTSRSQVWNYFNKNLKEQKIQCILCRKLIQFTNNTTNLLSHLKVWHINEYNKARAKPTPEDLLISDDDEIQIVSSNSQMIQTSLISHDFEVTPGCSNASSKVDEVSDDTSR